VFGSYLGFGGGDGGDAAAGEDFESEVTAAFGPLIGLLGQDGADEADDRVAVGEDAHGVGAPADLAVQALDGYLEPLAGLVP
jgi:hypothetical protein